MKGFCPSCEKETILIRIRRVEDFDIKGEKIAVDVEFFQCLQCGAQFDDPDPAKGPLAAAYREYRARKGMVQPDEIRAFRRAYDLSQRELSELTGFGGATLSRYENGALQDESHDKLLRLVMLPTNFLKVIMENPHALDVKKRQKLVERLKGETARAEFIGLIDKHGKYNEPNATNGMRAIDLFRLANAIKMLCYQTDVNKSKLAKLLFYADFKHYKEYGAGITGLCYAHLPRGPIPDGFELILNRISEYSPDLRLDEGASLDTGSEYVRCDTEPDRSSFSFSELQVLLQVDGFFKSFTTSRIMYFSLEEDASRQTKTGELISYELARRLRI